MIINLQNAYIIGCLLGLQYMSKACQGKGGSIINISSIMALEPYSGCPIYTSTQHAILGLTRALGYGDHYEKTRVRIMGLCPGFTHTELMRHVAKKCLNESYAKELENELECAKFQEASVVGESLIKLLGCGKPASIWVVENSTGPIEIKIPDVDTLLNKC